MPNIGEAQTFVDEHAAIAREVKLRALEKALDLALLMGEEAGMCELSNGLLAAKMRVVKLRRRLQVRG